MLCPVRPRTTIQPQHECADGDEAPEPDLAAALPGTSHVGAAEDGLPHDPGHGLAGVGTGHGARWGRDHIGGPTHDQTPFIPRGLFPI